MSIETINHPSQPTHGAALSLMRELKSTNHIGVRIVPRIVGGLITWDVRSNGIALPIIPRVIDLAERLRNDADEGAATV